MIGNKVLQISNDYIIIMNPVVPEKAPKNADNIISNLQYPIRVSGILM